MPSAPPPDRLHDQRHRAESFGGAAEAYDRYRPSYPDALIDDLVATHPQAALDIGCGTGKAARLVAARGVPVLGVEIDAQMAAVARRSGIAVEVASFESWDARGRTFDLVFSAQAWHWIDPAVGVPKAAAILRPGALLVLFWNAISLTAKMREALLAVYRDLAPEVVASPRTLDEHEDPAYAEDLKTSGLFAAVERRSYSWDRAYSAKDWVQMVLTHSDHLVLPEAKRAELVEAVTATIDSNGGKVAARYVTQAIVAFAPA